MVETGLDRTSETCPAFGHASRNLVEEEPFAPCAKGIQAHHSEPGLVSTRASHTEFSFSPWLLHRGGENAMGHARLASSVTSLINSLVPPGFPLTIDSTSGG